jgi:phosphoenolpyruvate-protein kinase (PTS system EI component)
VSSTPSQQQQSPRHSAPYGFLTGQKMKVKTINRNEEEYTRERSQDLKKVHRNLDPSLHQFQVRATGST